MNIEIIKQFLTFIILCLAQALVLNHINLFGCATPLLYVYFILLFRHDYPRWGTLLWSFFTGLCIDIFSNTQGVAATSTTLLGLMQPYVLNLFIQRDSPEDLKPTIRSLGMAKFIYYTIICVFAYNIIFFTIESFNFFNWLQWLKNIGGSTVLTVILIIVIENVRKR